MEGGFSLLGSQKRNADITEKIGCGGTTCVCEYDPSLFYNKDVTIYCISDNGKLRSENIKGTNLTRHVLNSGYDKINIVVKWYNVTRSGPQTIVIPYASFHYDMNMMTQIATGISGVLDHMTIPKIIYENKKC